MSISLHQLSVFRTVARHQSFSRAAEELGISQPAVSAHVRELERLYGVDLFEQTGRPVRLTEAGRLLEEYADRILGLLAETERSMNELKGLARGHLDVGASTIPGAYFLPEALGRFKERHPGIDTVLRVSDTHQVLGMVRRGEVDLAVVGEHSNQRDIERYPYRSDALVLVTSPRHQWALHGLDDVTALAEEPFLLRERGSSTRENAEEMLRGAGVTPRVTMEWQSTEAIKKAVENGLGVSILSELAVALEEQCGLLVIIRHPALVHRRQFYVVTHQDRRLSPVAHAFRELLLESEERSDHAQDGRNEQAPEGCPPGR
jgi:DNA-binding transcriptional LysR family regulator